MTVAPDTRELILAFQVEGIVSARVLAERLGISQPTLSRRLQALSGRLERIGSGRASRYALRRDIRHFGSTWPLYRLNEKGRPALWAELRAVHGGFRLIHSDKASAPWLDRDYPDGLFSGLPFFLQDIAPQGYLGRAIARGYSASLGVPPDPDNWKDEDIISYLFTAGDDLPGDFILGDRAVESALRCQTEIGTHAIPVFDRIARYPERAMQAQQGEITGSSAGGEQPKFPANLEEDGSYRSVLVKFTSADESPVRTRWSDLLACEQIAAGFLRARSIPAASTQILDAGQRRFLEIERFDRVNAAGRRGLLTLGALEDAFLDSFSTDWVSAAILLQNSNWLTPDSARRLRWLWCFGDLIANSDMHRSNASVQFITPPFELAPSYDMLPMLFAPGAQGDLAERQFNPRPPLPAVADVWSDAASAAIAYWDQVITSHLISFGFRAIAQRCRDKVVALQKQFA